MPRKEDYTQPTWEQVTDTTSRLPVYHPTRMYLVGYLYREITNAGVALCFVEV